MATPAATTQGKRKPESDDAMTEIGGDMFARGAAAATQGAAAVGAKPGPSVPRSASGSPSSAVGGTPLRAMERSAAPISGAGWGRGPIPVDKRKFRYDVLRGRSSPALSFAASKVDRMDAVEAGDMLHRLHEMFGIAQEEEARILAFDRALFFEHTINGASLLQPGRGTLTVAGVGFDIGPIKTMLGVDQRRFFRAFADDIAAMNREILELYDVYDPESVEKVGQLNQLAAERGLQKFPYLVHDSSDAGLALSYDERVALMASKRVVLDATVNQTDQIHSARSLGAPPLEARREVRPINPV